MWKSFLLSNAVAEITAVNGWYIIVAQIQFLETVQIAVPFIWTTNCQISWELYSRATNNCIIGKLLCYDIHLLLTEVISLWLKLSFPTDDGMLPGTLVKPLCDKSTLIRFMMSGNFSGSWNYKEMWSIHGLYYFSKFAATMIGWQ